MSASMRTIGVISLILVGVLAQRSLVACVQERPWRESIDPATVGRVWNILAGLSDSSGGREKALGKLSALGPDSLPSLCAVLWQEPAAKRLREDGQQDRPLAPGERRALMEAIKRHGPAPVTSFARRLAGKGAPAADITRAIQLLQRADQAATIPVLVEIFEGIDPACRRNPAVRGSFNNTLLAIFQRDLETTSVLAACWPAMSSAVRNHVLQGLAHSRSVELLGFLQDVLASDHSLEPVIIQRIADLGPAAPGRVRSATLRRIRGHLGGRRVALCRAATSCVGALNDRESVSKLLDLVGHRDRSIASGADGALRRITGLRIPQSAEGWQHWYESEQSWMAGAATDLLRTAQSDDEQKAVAAIHEIARHPLFAAELAEELAPALQSSSPWVRRTVCQALAKLRCRECLPKLVDCLRSEEDAQVRAAVHETLSAITGLQLPPDPASWQRAVKRDF